MVEKVKPQNMYKIKRVVLCDIICLFSIHSEIQLQRQQFTADASLYGRNTFLARIDCRSDMFSYNEYEKKKSTFQKI